MKDLLSKILESDPGVRKELSERNTSTGIAHAQDGPVTRTQLARVIRNGGAESLVSSGGEQAEAIVLFEGRPSLLIRDDSFETPTLGIWRDRLATARASITRAIPAVGRIEFSKHPLADVFPMLGTGWLIADNVIATNRHVASLFGFRAGDQFRFQTNPDGGSVGIRVDFKEEVGLTEQEEFSVAEIIHIEDDPGLDIALLKVRVDQGQLLGQPLNLGDPAERELVATIGYPGKDSRAPMARINSIFDGTFHVKRLAPGMIMNAPVDGVFNHDCSTLKGSSGSAVISLESGDAVGLHFAGQFGVANSAVSGAALKARLSGLNIAVTVRSPLPRRNVEVEAPEAPEGRTGYQADFLGADILVPMPGSAHPEAQTLDAGGTELRYTHFSVVLHAHRKIALATAVNIDGTSLRFIPRSGSWRKDARAVHKHHGNELYKNNDYDRGHMVRRLDPVWGDIDTAKKANADTFFFTNAAPQHKDLNQKHWVQLEEYILDNARARDLKLSVFTGPAFDPADPPHREVLIPRRFWKIVAFTDTDTGKLCASGYLLDQSHLVADIPEEFAFGAFKTFQVSIDLIARLTEIDFGPLVAADVLSTFESVQKIPITAMEDVILSPQQSVSSSASGSGEINTPKLSIQELHKLLLDPDTPESTLRSLVELDEEMSHAFSPVVKIREDALLSGEEEGAVLMGSFNKLSRFRRQRRYRSKIRNGWNGLRIVSEGDSWFQYPILLDDVIDHIFDPFAILSFGAAGDLLDDIIRQDEVASAIASENAHAFLVSGGGNDLLGNGRLQQYLKPFVSGRAAEDYLNERFQPFVEGILVLYKNLFSRLVNRFPHLHIFFHGYDYVIPNGGKWLGRPMESGLGISDRNLQRDILRVIINKYSDSLQSLVQKKVHFVDCRNVVGAGEWHDELHPTDAGYRRVSIKFQRAIEDHVTL